MTFCDQYAGEVTWQMSWSPVRLPAHSCDEHLAAVCRNYARSAFERPQDGEPYLFVTVHLT